MPSLIASRRSLLLSALAAGPVAGLAGRASAQVPGAAPAPEFYELRAYRLVRGPMQERLGAYLERAFIPAARRAGTGPIGVFTVAIGVGNPTLHVLIPHRSADGFLTLPQILAADGQYVAQAEPFRNAPALAPAYASLDVKLMRAFNLFPRLELPPASAARQPRIFELRTYRSHGEKAGARKIEMFEALGEIPIFRRTGLTPVLFAQDLTGPDLPSLTYLLTFPDLATRERSWNAFRADPEWAKLSATPGLTDPEIVTGIDNQVLAPTAYSQI